MHRREIQTYGNIDKGESKISAWDWILVKVILEPLEALGSAVYPTENPQQGIHGYLFCVTLNKRWFIKNDSSSDVKYCGRETVLPENDSYNHKERDQTEI